jgi:hypothetical protein
MWRNWEFEGNLPGIQNLELGLERFEWIDVCWSDTQQVDSQGTRVAPVGCTIYNTATAGPAAKHPLFTISPRMPQFSTLFGKREVNVPDFLRVQSGIYEYEQQKYAANGAHR